MAGTVEDVPVPNIRIVDAVDEGSGIELVEVLANGGFDSAVVRTALEIVGIGLVRVGTRVDIVAEALKVELVVCIVVEFAATIVIVGVRVDVVVAGLMVEVAVDDLNVDRELFITMGTVDTRLVDEVELVVSEPRLKTVVTNVMVGAALLEGEEDVAGRVELRMLDGSVIELESDGAAVEGAGLMMEYERGGQDFEQMVVSGFPVIVMVAVGSKSSVMVESMTRVVGGTTTVLVAPIVLITVARLCAALEADAPEPPSTGTTEYVGLLRSLS